MLFYYGVIESPNKIAGAMTGKYIDKDGKILDKNAIQRAAMLGDRYLSTAGLAMGTSKKLLSSLGRNIATGGAKEVVKTGFVNGAKDFVKNALTEGGEEAAQNILNELAEKGHLDNGTLGRTLEAGAMGVLGGVMMDGAGRAIGGIRNAYSENAAKVARDVQNTIAKKTPEGDVNISRLHLDQMGFNKDELIGKFTGDTRKRMSDRAFKVLQEQRMNDPYSTNDGGEVSLTNKGNTKLSRTGQNIPDELFVAKMRSTPRIGEIIENSQFSHSAPDMKNHGNARDGFDYRNSSATVSGKKYGLGLDIAKNQEAGVNTLYSMNIKESASGGFLRPPIQADSDISNIPQTSHEVKRRQKTRGFVENILKNDPDPPTEFLEATKGKTYTPKKNADLWRTAIEDVARYSAKAFLKKREFSEKLDRLIITFDNAKIDIK